MVTFSSSVKVIDKISAISGGILSIILILYCFFRFHRIIYIFPGIFTLMACIFWLSIRNNPSLTFFQFNSYSLILLLDSIFFCLFLCSVLSVYFRPSLYERPLIYFALTSLMVGIVSLKLFTAPINKYLILFQIILIGLSISWSQLILFPSLVGIDTFAHRIITLDIIRLHNIPEGYDYSKIPLFHLFIALTSITTGLDYKLSTMLSISFLQVICPALLVYLFSNFLFKNNRISLLSSVSIIICNLQIFMSYWSIPNGFCTLFILYLLYSLLLLKIKHPFTSIFFSFLFMIASILTHTITSFFIDLVLCIYCIGFILNPISESKNKISITYFLLFTILMLSWWMYVSGTLFTVTYIFKLGAPIDIFNRIPQAFLYRYLASIPLSEQLFNFTGIFLFFAFSFIGCFYMVSDYGNYNTFSFTLIGFLPLFLGFISLISNHDVLQQRWWYFAQTFLSIPFALSLVLIMNTLKVNFLKPLFLFLFMVGTSILLIMSPAANVDNHVFSPNSSMTYSLKMSELQAAETVSYFWNGTIKVDSYYVTGLGLTNNRYKSFDYELYEQNMSRSLHDFVLIRKEIIGKPFALFSSVVMLNYDPRDLTTHLYFSKVYDCGSVEGYLKEDFDKPHFLASCL